MCRQEVGVVVIIKMMNDAVQNEKGQINLHNFMRFYDGN